MRRWLHGVAVLGQRAGVGAVPWRRRVMAALGTQHRRCCRATIVCWCPTCPGPRRIGMVPAHSETAEAIADVVAAASMHAGADARYDLVGFSFGGTMASCVAAMHGARVRSLDLGFGGVGPSAAQVELLKVRHLEGAGAGGHASHQSQSTDDRRSGEDR